MPAKDETLDEMFTRMAREVGRTAALLSGILPTPPPRSKKLTRYARALEKGHFPEHPTDPDLSLRYPKERLRALEAGRTVDARSLGDD
jgi:hypothetical protein